MTTFLSILFWLGLIVLGAYLLFQFVLIPMLLRQVQEKAKNANIDIYDPLLGNLDPQLPALVYFTSDDCVPCKTTQAPAIEKLRQEMPELQVITVNAPQNIEVAERWGVMAVPRTFVIGRERQVHTSNMDVALTSKLKQQIEAAMQAETIDKIEFHEAEASKSFFPKFSIKLGKQ